MKKLTFMLGLIATTIVVSTVVGCRKKKDTIASIFITDITGAAVSGAQVILYGSPSSGNNSSSVIRYDTATTNSAGEATFNYNEVYKSGQAGVAVLEIKAKKGAAVGTGIIKVEEEKTTEKRIVIN